MANTVNDDALDALFRNARTFAAWQDRAVSDDLLREVYALAALGPTSANTNPMRVVFVKSPAGKERLKPALSPGNVDKTMSAPVTAIIAADSRFFELIPRLWHDPKMADFFTAPGQEEFVKIHALRNSSLQGAYLILAARALGLDVGPMSGFDAAKVDAEFFPDGRFKANFLANLGYGDASKLRPRLPRLSFDEAASII